MRNWFGWAGVACVVAGGIWWVAQGGGERSHCGTCVCPVASVPARKASSPGDNAPVMSPVRRPTTSDVIDVVEFEQVMADPIPEPRRLPILDFDAGIAFAPSRVQPTSFVSPGGAEIAPAPRPVVPATIPLAKEDAPF